MNNKTMNIKAMQEKRNDLMEQAQEIFNAASDAGRDLTPDEDARFHELCDQVKRSDAMIARAKELQFAQEHIESEDYDIEDYTGPAGADDVKYMKQFAADVHELAGYIKNMAKKKGTGGDFVDTASSNMTYGDNGAVVKHTIIDKIIEKVDELTPLYQLSNKYPVSGTVTIPLDDESTDSITIALATEFTELTSHSGKISSVSLNAALFGALTKVSKKLINSSDFALVNWLINKFARKLALWYDEVFINGKLDGNNDRVIGGILPTYDSTNMKITLASKDDVTVDELIDLQELLPDDCQKGAFWIMDRSTRTKIRKLKNAQGDYILTNDNNSRWGKVLLDADVYTTKSISALGTVNKDVIIYVNPAGIGCQEPPTREIEVLNELFAAQHAVGIVLWGEIDVKVENTQMAAVARTPAA